MYVPHITFTSSFLLKDVNECESTDVCKFGECVNTLGSYYCKCGQGFEMVNDTCVKSTGCKQGFERVNETCIGKSHRWIVI
jgi:Calcium-binding EGF domain.